MISHENSETKYYTFENLSGFDQICHFVSTRKGGLSDNHFASLNTGFHVGDDNFKVLQNRRILANAVGIDILKLTFANQCHSANVAIVNESGRGKGVLEKETAVDHTDGLVTNVKDVCLCVQVADCVPILLYDPVCQVVAAVHAGWKGTLRKIASEAVAKMIQHYGCKAENIYAGLGPSNGPCCYEVGPDVYREVKISLGQAKNIIFPGTKPDKYIFDQWQANVRQLTDAGLKKEHIEQSDICTQCHSDTFFSSRQDQGHTGRFMAGIMLKKPKYTA